MNRPGLKLQIVVGFLSAFIILEGIEPVYINQSLPSSIAYSSSMELIDVINSLRISNGLPAYQINQTLMYIAQNHSEYQASISSVTHYGADGSRPFQRALSAGYPVAGDLSLGGYFSENIISGINLSASGAVNSWKLDAPHLNSMLSSTLQDIGAGVAVAGDTIFYTIDVGLSTSVKIETSPQVVGIKTIVPLIPPKILTSTPGSDGSIFHVVKIGDTIWSICQVYKISEQEFIKMNSIKGNLIYVGDKFLIRPSFTPTPLSPTATPTIQVSQRPSQTPTIKSTSIDNLQPTITPSEPTASENNSEIFLAIISLTFLLASLFTFLGFKRNNN